MSKKKSKQKEIQQAILRQLSNNGHRAFRPKELAQKLGYHPHGAYKLFRATLQDLVDAGKIRRIKGNRFAFKSESTETSEGTLRVNRDGYGFVEVAGREEDVFIPRTYIRSGLDGDRVKIRVNKSEDNRDSGEILEVLERKRQHVAGTTTRRRGTFYIIPDDTRFTRQIFIHESETADLKPDLKVIATLGEYDSFRSAYRASIDEVLGHAEDPQALMEALIRQFDLPRTFPDAVEKEATDTSERIPEAEYQRRLDLREHPIFTIDPNDAKDFDDAIHVIPLPSGRYEVGVHIADVSYYVPLHGAIDQEAAQRATSIYLADRVTPMLPERLSNNLCSLRPGEEKLAFSCILEVDENAVVHTFRFVETIIRSQQRFTYEEAQEIIEGKNGDHPMADSVLLAQNIASAFTKKRFAQGSIEFDVPEVRVQLDASGMPIAIRRKEIRAANRLIEEFMLLANQCAAKAIEHPDRSTPPFVYRIHDRPNEERIQQLITYVRTFGLQLKLDDGNLSSVNLNKLLRQIQGSAIEPIIKTAALRSMAKASYSDENIGHYGLGFSHYSHFTSPIRRYPDLIAHRLLKYYLFQHDTQQNGSLASLCEHCSEMERRAEEAERASTRQKQVLYAMQHLGESFDGVITSATRFGLFVELDGIWLEGLVHVRDLLDDYYEYDKDSYALMGSHTGKAYRAGDKIHVQLARANPHTREIELALLS